MMSNSVDKNSLLHRLGDNWHAVSPYLPLIEKVVPQSKYQAEIQDVLYTLYVDEHYNFKQSKHVSKDTLYSNEVEVAQEKMNQLEEEMVKEEKILQTLSQKFELVQDFLVYTSNDLDEDDNDDDYVDANAHHEKGKGNMIKAKVKGKKLSPQEEAKIMEEKKKATTARNTKMAMATSQQKLLDMQQEFEHLEKKKKYYQHYHYASYGRQCGMKRLVLAYEKDKDLITLIQGLDELLDYFHMMFRRYIPPSACDGTYHGLCASHYLPFSAPARYSEKGTLEETAKCPLHAIA